MIGFVRGMVLGIFKSGKNTTSLVLWTSEQVEGPGVGYTVLVSDIQAASVVDGKSAELWTYSVQNDNESYLIGFSSSDKLRLFLQLLSVSGVGPKSAMQIIDTVGIEQITDALINNDVSVFNKVSGIGKKTAAKIIVELSGRDLNLKTVLQNPTKMGEAYPEVVATLQKLGYSVSAAREAVEKASIKLSEHAEYTVAEKVKLVLSLS